MILQDSEQARTKAAEIIRRGGVIAFRTDTFYGLGVDPLNQAAVQKIRELKGREDTKPILLLISDPRQVDRFITHQSEAFKTVADRFWPGPITLVGIARAALPIELTAGTEKNWVRFPGEETLRRPAARGCGGLT